MADIQFKPATGKLLAVDTDRGVTLWFRPIEIAEEKLPRTLQVHIRGTLVRVVLQEPHWTMDDMLAIAKILSPRGIEVTLRHI